MIRNPFLGRGASHPGASPHVPSWAPLVAALKISLDDRNRSADIGCMARTPDPLLISPKQIQRYLEGHFHTALAEVCDLVAVYLNRDTVDVSGWATWQTKGIHASDLRDEAARVIVSLIEEFEDDFLAMRPTEVRQWRESHNLSQPEAAELLGVARSTWSRWEQLGINDHYAGTAAYVLAASATGQNPGRVQERDRAIRSLLDLEERAKHKPPTQMEAAVVLSRWGGMGEYAKFGLGSYGVYRLLREAWENLGCQNCRAMNPTDSRFCSACGSPLNRKEV